MSKSVIFKPGGDQIFTLAFWAQDPCWHNIIVSPLCRACSHHTPTLLRISLTLQGPAAFTPTPVHHFTLKVPTMETGWLTAALQRRGPVPLCCYGYHLLSGAVEMEEEQDGVRTGLMQPVVLWGQFRWLALKCKLKWASLCSFKVTRARQCNVKLSLPCLCCVRCGDWQKLLVIV